MTTSDTGVHVSAQAGRWRQRSFSIGKPYEAIPSVVPLTPDSQWHYIYGLVVRVTMGETCVIAEDMDDLSYGMGDTPAEAVADWYAALITAREILTEHRNALAPHLTKKLAAIESKLKGYAGYGTLVA